MQQIFLDGFVKGYARPMLYYKSYITHPNYTNSKEIVDFRLRVIQHYEKHRDIDATLDAFNISRSTLYNWMNRLKTSRGKLESLAPTSTTPHTQRHRQSYPFVTEQIICLRAEHPKIGKSKLKPILDTLCVQNGEEIVSESTIGRLIKDLKQAGRLSTCAKLAVNGRTGKLHEIKPKSKLKKLRRGAYMPHSPGDLVQVDCIEKFIDGVRRYIISGIDYKSSFAYSYTYSRLTSHNARDFILKLQQVAPFTITHIQTDNGHEFYKEFIAELDYQKLVHFWNYPRSPKSNGKIERYNRSIQEEFVDYHLEEMRDNQEHFNQLLTDWLIYYNTKRPHAAHKTTRTNTQPSVQMPPMKALIYMLGLEQLESNMLWTHTIS